jgi:hypothetical protein
VAVEKLTYKKSAEKRLRQDALQTTFPAGHFLSPKFPLISEISRLSTATPVNNS